MQERGPSSLAKWGFANQLQPTVSTYLNASTNVWVEQVATPLGFPQTSTLSLVRTSRPLAFAPELVIDHLIWVAALPESTTFPTWLIAIAAQQQIRMCASATKMPS